MMIAFITVKSSLVPLIEGLCAQCIYIYMCLLGACNSDDDKEKGDSCEKQKKKHTSSKNSKNKKPLNNSGLDIPQKGDGVTLEKDGGKSTFKTKTDKRPWLHRPSIKKKT